MPLNQVTAGIKRFRGTRQTTSCAHTTQSSQNYYIELMGENMLTAVAKDKLLTLSFRNKSAHTRTHTGYSLW